MSHTTYCSHCRRTNQAIRVEEEYALVGCVFFPRHHITDVPAAKPMWIALPKLASNNLHFYPYPLWTNGSNWMHNASDRKRNLRFLIKNAGCLSFEFLWAGVERNEFSKRYTRSWEAKFFVRWDLNLFKNGWCLKIDRYRLKITVNLLSKAD